MAIISAEKELLATAATATFRLHLDAHDMCETDFATISLWPKIGTCRRRRHLVMAKIPRPSYRGADGEGRWAPAWRSGS